MSVSLHSFNAGVPLAPRRVVGRGVVARSFSRIVNPRRFLTPNIPRASERLACARGYCAESKRGPHRRGRTEKNFISDHRAPRLTRDPFRPCRLRDAPERAGVAAGISGKYEGSCGRVGINGFIVSECPRATLISSLGVVSGIKIVGM